MITMLAATVATVLAVIQRSARIVVIGEGMGARTLVGDCQGIRAKRKANGRYWIRTSDHCCVKAALLPLS